MRIVHETDLFPTFSRASLMAGPEGPGHRRVDQTDSPRKKDKSNAKSVIIYYVGNELFGVNGATGR